MQQQTYLTLCCRCQDVPAGSLVFSSALYRTRQFLIVYDLRDVVEARHRIGLAILNWLSQEALTQGEAFSFGERAFHQLMELSA